METKIAKTKFLFSAFAAILLVLLAPIVFSEEANSTTTSDADLTLDAQVEQEIAEVDSVSDSVEQAAVEEMADEINLDEDVLAEEINMPMAEVNEFKGAGKRIGEKQYILNAQLKHKVIVAGITSDAIIKHLQKKGADTTELSKIKEEIKSVLSSINESQLTREDFIAKLSLVKTLSTQFRNTVHGLVPEAEREELKKAIEDELKANKDKIEKARLKELKARMLYNKKQINNAMDEVNKEMLQLKKDNVTLLSLTDRQKSLNQLREGYLGKNATKENVAIFREQWKGQLDKYKQERFDTQLKNERVENAKEAKVIIGAIKEAKKNGENTTQLVQQFKNVRDEIKDMNSKKIKEADFNAKREVVKSKIQKMKEDKIISGRISEIRNRAREGNLTRSEIKSEIKNEIKEVRETGKGGALK